MTGSGQLRYAREVAGVFVDQGPVDAASSATGAALAVGPDGTRYLLSVPSSDASLVQLRVAPPGNGVPMWSEPISVSVAAAACSSPAVLLDPGGTLRMAWSEQKKSGMFANIATRNRDPGGSISPELIPQVEDYTQTDVQLTLDSNNRVHMTYLRDNRKVQHAAYKSGVWDGDALPALPGSVVGQHPTIATAGETLIVAWEAKTSDTVHDIAFSISQDGGAFWSTPVRVTGGVGWASSPAVSWPAGADRWQLAWLDTAASSDGKSDVWTTSIQTATVQPAAPVHQPPVAGSAHSMRLRCASSRCVVAWHNLGNPSGPRVLYQSATPAPCLSP
jgi:hypothetical protein